VQYDGRHQLNQCRSECVRTKNLRTDFFITCATGMSEETCVPPLTCYITSTHITTNSVDNMDELGTTNYGRVVR
jgi:hypothetical protein